jgi:hypothetical protein
MIDPRPSSKRAKRQRRSLRRGWGPCPCEDPPAASPDVDPLHYDTTEITAELPWWKRALLAVAFVVVRLFTGWRRR